MTSGITPTWMPPPTGMLATSIGAGAELAAVGGESFEQAVLDEDREPEGDEERRQDVLAERAVQHAALQEVAERRHHRDEDDDRHERVEAGRLHEDSAMKAASTIRSPCAMLTSRITPKMSDSPAAKSA